MMRAQQKKLVQMLNHRKLNSVSNFELIKAKDAIEQFIYSCSHTLRSPLKSISGLVHLLKNSNGDPDFDPKLFLESIEKTVAKMESLLNDLETFLSNSRQSIALHPVEVKAVIIHILDQFRSELIHRKIQVKIENHQPTLFFTDEKRMEAVLTHVLSNAVQFCDYDKENREIRIRIRVTNTFCKIQIRDNGIGIAPEVLPNIFDLFYRGSARATGSGVGLYIAREVLSKMSGTIKARSRENIGSSFLIMIPNLAF